MYSTGFDVGFRLASGRVSTGIRADLIRTRSNRRAGQVVQTHSGRCVRAHGKIDPRAAKIGMAVTLRTAVHKFTAFRGFPNLRMVPALGVVARRTAATWKQGQEQALKVR